MSKNFDVVVIGGGPGGYIAAIRAAQLGFTTACIDEWKNDKGGPAPGGTCTNVGCIPSKALLQSSEHYEQAGHHFADHGIEVEGLSLDLDEDAGAQGHGRQAEQRRHPLPVQEEQGHVLPRPRLVRRRRPTAATRSRSPARRKRRSSASTSSSPPARTRAPLPGAPFDEENILSNDGALRIGGVPKKLGVIGVGRDRPRDGFGLAPPRRRGDGARSAADLPRRGRRADRQGSARRPSTKQGLKIELGVKIGEVKIEQEGREQSPTPTPRAARRRSTVDKLIVSIGRVPNTDRPERRGRRPEARRARLRSRSTTTASTNLPNVWAIGDVVRGPMLAHKAEEEGVAVAERIAGQHGHVNFNTIPWVIYTSPGDRLGRPDRAAAEGRRPRLQGRHLPVPGQRPRARAGRHHRHGQVPRRRQDRRDPRRAHRRPDGLRADLRSRGGDGVPGAAAEDIARICHAHPSLSEATKEAALAVDKRTLNF